MMKVLFLIDSLSGYGAEKSLVQIAINFKQVIPIFIHVYKGDNLKHLLLEKDITVYSLNIEGNYSYKQALHLIVPIIEKEHPEIIHATLFRSEMIARRLKLRFPYIKLVGSFVSNSYCKRRYAQLSLLSKFKLLTTQLKDRKTAGKVDYFISNSRAIMNTNRKALNIPPEKIKIIYRGRQFNKQNISEEPLDIKNTYSLENKIIFLNVGRLHQGKAQMDLLYAFKNATSEMNAVLIIAGEGLMRSKLELAIKTLDLENKVFLLGYRDDIPQLLAAADYFIFPSYFEGLPGALIEAIIANTPVIASDIPENKECFPLLGALFFKSGDIADLSLKIEEATKLNNWKQRTDSSFSYALENFDIYNISREYEEFYFSILENSKFKFNQYQ